MEQSVAERPFSQEQQTSHLQTWHNGTLDNGSTHLRQDVFMTRDPRRSAGWDRPNMSTGRFHGDNIREHKGRAPICLDNTRGKCARGLSCKFLHSDFVAHDGVRFCRNDQRNSGPVADPRNSQLFSENKDGDSSRRSAGGCRSRSPCRRFQSGRCYRGSTCPYIHPEFSNYSENNVDDSSRRSFFRESRNRSPCRNFQNGRCYRGSACPYVHPGFAESDRSMHNWNAEQHHGVAPASRNSGFHAENNILPTPQVHDGAIKENNLRMSFSREPRNRSPCRNFLRGRCDRGASCRRWHPANTENHHGFTEKESVISSREHDEAHQRINIGAGSFSGQPRSPCQYFLGGSCYQGAPSANLHPVTVYERTRYDLGTHHRARATSSDLRFERGNVREVNYHGMRPYQDSRAGSNVSVNVVGFNRHDNARLTNEQFASNGENTNEASRSWSSERKRSRPANYFGADQLQPEVCLKFTKGRCDLGGNCKYLHSYHEYASSISQKSRVEAATDSMRSHQANQCAETMVAQGHAAFRNDQMLSNECKRTENTFVSAAEGNEDVSLWSRPFKRHRTGSRSSIRPEDDVHCGTLRRDCSLGNHHKRRCDYESLNQYPDRHSLRHEGLANHMNTEQHPKAAATSVNPPPQDNTDSIAMVPDGHDKLVSHAIQPDQCFNSISCSEAAILSNKNEVESATNALGCNQADQMAEKLVTESITVENSEGATATNQKPAESDSTSSFEEPDISPENTTMVVLEKDDTARVNVDLSHEANEQPEETDLVVKTSSRRRRRRQNKSESKSSFEEPDTSPENTTMIILEKDDTAGVNVDLSHEANEQPEETDLVIKTSSRKRRRRQNKSDSKSSFEEPDISPENTTMIILEKDDTAGVNVDLSHEANEQPEETDLVVKTSSRRKRCRQRRGSSIKGVISMTEEVTDTSSQSLPISSSILGTSLDDESVVPVSGHSDDTRTRVREADDMADVLVCDNPVEEKGNVVEAIKVQNTMVDSSSAVTEDSILLGKTADSALPASQPVDAAMANSRRKLLVLDVNGLLADIVADFPDRSRPIITVAGKGVFKRPFCDDFLQFCFEKFDVGIWSSRTKKNVTRVVDCLMKDTKDKLLFCWDQSQCTQTGYKTIENKEKPLVLKELKKLWEHEGKDLPWKKGFYNETNTILLDDSPYKALRNPPYTAVFPYAYSFRDNRDKSLGPRGDLRVYLKKLAEAEDVQKFIQENPFGQRAITKANPSWTYYSKIVGNYGNQPEAVIAITVPDSPKHNHVGKLSDTDLTVAECSAEPSGDTPQLEPL